MWTILRAVASWNLEPEKKQLGSKKMNFAKEVCWTVGGLFSSISIIVDVRLRFTQYSWTRHSRFNRDSLIILRPIILETTRKVAL